MNGQKFRRWSIGAVLLLSTLTVGVLTLGGCGGGYSDPNGSVTTTKTASALIEAATLNQWVAEGKLNNQDPAARDKVVILSVSELANYNAGHIPGSVLVNSASELNMTRMEGVTTITTMVLNGPSIDSIIKKAGIDANTTVVFTVRKGGSWLNMARAYFTFRYWGFPKERLKILNGGDDAWVDAGFAALDTTVPTIKASTYSVRNNASLKTELRFAVGDMINLVDQINAGIIKTDVTGVSILDVRGGSPSVYVANAVIDDFNQYGAAPAAGKTVKFKSKTDVEARLSAMGVTASKSMTYVYCASGMRASVPFFVIDAMMGWPVTLYDGSWNQWSSYLTSVVGSVWAVDTARSTGTVTPPATSQTTLDPISKALFGSVTDSRANQIKLDDVGYFSTGTAAPAIPGASSGGGGGGC